MRGDAYEIGAAHVVVVAVAVVRYVVPDVASVAARRPTACDTSVYHSR